MGRPAKVKVGVGAAKIPSDAWGDKRAGEMRSLFYEFLNHVQVSSKELGWIILGEHLYPAQTRAIDAIFDGLAIGIHDFKILKSRQLGISTVIRALLLFWCGMFDGITGSLVFDTAQHLDEARDELVRMLGRLPASFQFPREKTNNRYALILSNLSRVNLTAAGVRESKSAKVLGAGSAVSVAHRSELCGYGNVAGMESWRHSLARKNPNRLFIDESTARGPNIWKEIWDEAKKDPHCRCIFVGWWSHPMQRMERDDDDWERYGVYPPNDKEKEKIKQVKELYNYDITQEQLAWVRREMDPDAEMDGDAEPNFEGTAARLQEQPWTEIDSWQLTGATFFDPQALTRQLHSRASKKLTTYTFVHGAEFTDTYCYSPAPNARMVHLKVWEEPLEDAVYVVSYDPAFGGSEENDRSAIQVLRCYADGCDQVAEYAWPLVTTQQLAWVGAALEGWYGGMSSTVYRIVELQGPGDAVLRELRDLPVKIARGYFGRILQERGLQAIQKNVRNYFYTRTDSLTQGRAISWKSTGPLKVAIMERLRDFTHSGALWVRSLETLNEMTAITRDGDQIRAEGRKKDDRVLALAIGLRCWESQVRRYLIGQGRTRENDKARRAVTIQDQITMFNDHQLSSFLAGKSAVRRTNLALQRRAAWRGRAY